MVLEEEGGEEGDRDGSLTDPLPQDPLPVLSRWLAEARARAGMRNPDALALATADRTGMPQVRMVLARRFDAERGCVSFYTNYESPKARELEGAGRASGVFYWDALGRQVRLEGPIERTSAADSDDYFAGRHPRSQIAAWTSAQSQPVASRARLAEKLEETASRFGGLESPDPVPRPPHWGGYRLWIERLELWVDRPGRLHDRGLWIRRLEPATAPEGRASPLSLDGRARPTRWSVERLQP